MASTEISAYAQAVNSGQYARVTGLGGKYDNVRVHWEDEALRLRLRPHLQQLVDRRLAQGRGFRLADFGCGSGDGFESLMSMTRSDARWQDHDVKVIPPRHLNRYMGLELNPALLEQARVRYSDEPAARFVQADLREGLPWGENEPPFDIYFASFGTFSHLSEADTVSLVAEIAQHAADGSLIMVDWLGRYACEWTDLWSADVSREQWMDYRISYIYSEEERAHRDIDSFPLRLLSPDEARRVFECAGAEAGITLKQKELFDRSLFVGRHMETGDYNRHARPLRSAVNRLHESLCRTDLESLLFDLHVPDGFAEPRTRLESVHTAWNALVRFTIESLEQLDASAALPEIPGSLPEHVRGAMARVRQAVEAMPGIQADDPRAEWLEPRLGLALRDVELAGGPAAGCGHGLVAVYEIHKR